MKKITSVLFISLALAVLMAVSAFAASDILYSGEEDNFEWYIDEDGELYIEGDYIDSFGTNSNNRAPWYQYRDDIETIVIDEDITDIGSYAFYKLESVVEVELPEELTKIGMYAFSDCVSLKSIEIPEYVVAINTGAFYNCRKLKTVELPDDLQRIRSNAFAECKSLIEIVIPNDVTTIESGAFAGCSSLEGVYFLGDRPSTVAATAFEDLDKNEDLVIYYTRGSSGFASTYWKNYTLDTFTSSSIGRDDDDDDDGWIDDDDDDDDVYYGDLNEDGKINSSDLRLMRYSLAFWKNYDIDDYDDIADVDEDGEITPIDEIILARYIDNWKDFDELPY